MLISRVLFYVLLLIIIKDITGFEKNNPTSDDEDYSDANSGSAQSTIMNNDNCDDAYSNYSDCSFYHELIGLTSNGMINIATDVILLSIVPLSGLENFTIIGNDIATVNCDNAGGIHIADCHNCTIIGITWEKCGNKNDNTPAIELYNSSNIIIQNCSFRNSVTQSIVLSKMLGNVTINGCTFAFNKYHYKDHGVAIHYLPKIKHHSKFQFTISNCNFTHNGVIHNQIIVYIGPSRKVFTEQVCLINCVFLNNRGTPIYVQRQNVLIAGNMLFMGNSARRGGGIFIINHIHSHAKITFLRLNARFINNKVWYGGALYLARKSKSMFEGNCRVTINNNFAIYNGGALYIEDNSDLMFQGNSTVIINDNLAGDDGAIYIRDSSSLTFAGNSKATINNNQAYYRNGGAIFIKENSALNFKENSTAQCNNNQAKFFAGAIYIELNSNMSFEGNSILKISNNQAKYGGAIYIRDNSNTTFEGHSKVTISNNQADYFGAIYIRNKSDLKFVGSPTVAINNNQAKYSSGAIYIKFNSNLTSEGNSSVIINDNKVTKYGGAVYINGNSDFTFEGNSTLTINNNQADYGGAIYIFDNSYLKFKGNSTVTINNNQAVYGGAIYITNNSTLKFNEKSSVKINTNQAKYQGGAIYSEINCDVTFKGNSTVTINNNQAFYDGAIYIRDKSVVTFERNCVVKINDNKANKGGAFYVWVNSNVTIEGNAVVTINNNQANEGGAVYIWDNSNVMFEGNSTVTITNNVANDDGGAFNIWYNSTVTVKGNTIVTINNNQAINGGALYIQQNSFAIFNGSSEVKFDNNSASADGGALHANNNCSVKVKGNSTVIFNNNQASGNGGAIYFNNHINVMLENSSRIMLKFNTADNYGGAIYSTIIQIAKYLIIREFEFSRNRAGEVGNLLYIEVPKSCIANCLTDINTGINNDILWHNLSDRLIATSPNTLTLHYPAKCISDDSVDCEKYYIDNIMLGQEITIPACLLDYYNRPAEVTQFTIIGEDHQNYYVYGSQYILISCNHSIEGISIIGNQTIISSLNYSMFLTSHISSKSARKSIVVNLTVELSPCYPGFLYHSISQKCECYNNSGIVYCSGSSSAIKRGYWFGNVTGIPTVTFCPISYCNFTCCKTTNGYYQLSPTRNNQCKLYRVGIACGSCQNGYTLPYYSSQCVSIDKCTMIWSTVIVILTVLYWVAIVMVVFIMMHYQINIGKLYAITYYYSIVDALLCDNLNDLSDGLYTFINIIYSIAKLIPQFLGKLCLVKGISGIDQQFIHYIHPLAVAFILIMITLLARCSRRMSLLISRTIIPVICFLLLLSYTSVTTASLLLLKYLKFSDVTKVYTYLSPDTEYFHGHHLVYGVIAILCTITFVIGLPLLLLLEPFINHKISLTKIKPILDQFQGCYKDKYRWFAAYYMICRLVIISIIIVFTSNDFTARYLLITVCAVIVLVHLISKPYNSKSLNIFDAVLLLLLVLTTVLLLIDFTESNLAIQVTLFLLILPLMIVGAMCLLAYRVTIKSVVMNLFNKVYDDDSNNNHEVPTRNFDIIVDDSMRRNATVCGM